MTGPQPKTEEMPDEKVEAREVQLATLNILEDFNAEKTRLEGTQRAVLNILDDFNAEKTNLEGTQKATLNILEDFNAEKTRLEETQRAVLNILDDLNQSGEDLQKAHDILEVRVRERTAELQRRTLELEASNRELEAFSYSVSHDLRAPLRVMDGFSQAILEDFGDKLNSEGKEYLQYIRTSSQLMARLIDDLLNLSRITRAELNLQKVNLSEIALEVVKDLQRSQPGRRVEFIIAPGLEAYGDNHLLKLVLENLLGNASKFTARQPTAKIEFGVTRSHGAEAYFVRDNGAGFDMTYAHKLFKPFQRLHRPEDFSGTGIGLASVHRIINRLGGKVWAEGEPDKGAAFYFTLAGTEPEITGI
ncbi:MAG: hypothetical protein HY668_00885 [Chloroflexi bacterium]|nr:hypothetical protein [Chloroflexota bacterium]